MEFETTIDFGFDMNRKEHKDEILELTTEKDNDKEENADTLLMTMNYLLSKSVLEKITKKQEQQETDLLTYREKIETMIQDIFHEKNIYQNTDTNKKIDKKCKEMFLDFVNTCNEYFREQDKWNDNREDK